MNRSDLNHIGSLITYEKDGKEYCLTDLLDSGEHGIFDPNAGLLPITSEEASLHNKAYSKAQIQGMDTNCQIGQFGYAYFDGIKVSTWIGETISLDFTLKGRVLTFRRNGRVFRGRLRKNTNNFNFERIR